MSIFINLLMIPQRISPDKWREVYGESLRLLQAYDFMDCFSARRNGLEYQFSGKSRDRENFLETGYRGWRSIGDIHSGEITDDYILFGDIRAYLPLAAAKDEGRDILLYTSDEMILAEKQKCCINIWGGVTEGKDSHIYLLAIACLFAARFPEAMAVSGNISARHCDRAVRWANQYLDRPIDVPDNGRMDRLLDRLKRASVSRSEILKVFFELSIEARDDRMGDFLKKMFTDKEISSYYKARLMEFRPDQRGFVSVLKEYLEMGFSFEELCRAAVKAPDGPGVPLEDFLAYILEFKLHIREKETGDLTELPARQIDSERVYSAEEEFARVIGKFLGAENKNVKAYYPLERIRKDCERAFGSRCDMNSVIEQALERQKNTGRAGLQELLYDGTDSIFKRDIAEAARKSREKKYDISAYKELGSFVPGCSMKPELEEDIAKNFREIYQFAQKEFEEFRVLGREERENYFISNNENILLSGDVWDRIFERVEDDEYIIRIFGLFCVNTESKDGYRFCKSLFSGFKALDYFWERTVNGK